MKSYVVRAVVVVAAAVLLLCRCADCQRDKSSLCYVFYLQPRRSFSERLLAEHEWVRPKLS